MKGPIITPGEVIPNQLTIQQLQDWLVGLDARIGRICLVAIDEWEVVITSNGFRREGRGSARDISVAIVHAMAAFEASRER